MFDNIPDILTAKECQQLLKIGQKLYAPLS